MERQRGEEEVKNRSSKKGQDEEKAILNRLGYAKKQEKRHFRGVLTLEVWSRHYSDRAENGDISSSSNSGSLRTPSKLPPAPPQSVSSGYKYYKVAD
ncbi:hypothetical protein ACOSP7_000157 [Xanthoceras sorbifolium]